MNEWTREILTGRVFVILTYNPLIDVVKTEFKTRIQVATIDRLDQVSTSVGAKYSIG